MVSGRLAKLLSRVPIVGIDTNIWIYLLNENPKYISLVQDIFNTIRKKHTTVILSPLALLEILVQPYRMENEKLIHEVYALLATFPGVEWVDMNIRVADRAAELRAKYKLMTPDAIHLATLLEKEGKLFIGNDRSFKKIREIDFLYLEDLLKP